MGPTLAMNLNPQDPAKHVGPLIPLVFLVSTLLLLMVAWCFARLSRECPNSGSAYGFVTSVFGKKAGFVTGWILFGTYVAFTVVGISGFGVFRDDIAHRLHPSLFFFTLAGALIVGVLSISVTRRATFLLLLMEGVAITAMLALSVGVLWRIAHGHGPQGDPPLVALFLPGPGFSPAAFALALSFGFLSFAGFEEVATLGEEVRSPAVTIPRALYCTVLGAGLIFVLVTVAEVLGYGTDAAGISRFDSSKSLLGDLGAAYFGGWCGDLVDLLAVFSALGCGLASVLAASRVLYAVVRDHSPGSPLLRLSGGGETPLRSSLWVVSVAFCGYALMRLAFHGRGSAPFFWSSTLGALGLLVVYFLVVACAGVSVLRSGVSRWKVVIPVLAAVAIAYTLFVNVWPLQPGAYGGIPWIVIGWCLLPLGILPLLKLRRE